MQVKSRSFKIGGGELKALVPFADMLNHDNSVKLGKKDSK